MRINGSAVHYPSIASRASAFGAEFAVALLITGCEMGPVVSVGAGSDYALCIGKREAGGVATEVAALECMDVCGVVTPDKA